MASHVSSRLAHFSPRKEGLMNPKSRLFGAALLVPALLAVSSPAGAADDPPTATSPAASTPQTYPPYPGKVSPQALSKASSQGVPSPYRSQGPSVYSNIPKPPTKSTGQLPTLATSQSNPSPYRSEGPPSLLAPPKPLPASQGSGNVPSIGEVATPYKSSGPASLAALGSPQVSSDQASGAPYLGAGGTMNAPSPYESTAAPGTSSPFAPRSDAPNANQGTGAGPAAGTGTGTGAAASSRHGPRIGRGPLVRPGRIRQRCPERLRHDRRRLAAVRQAGGRNTQREESPASPAPRGPLADRPLGPRLQDRGEPIARPAGSLLLQLQLL